MIKLRKITFASKRYRVLVHGVNFKIPVLDSDDAKTQEISGFYATRFVNAKDEAEAIALAQRFMSVAGEGEGEVLQVFDGPDIPSPG